MKGKIIMDSATVAPVEKGVSDLSRFSGKGHTIHNEMATRTPEGKLVEQRKSSGMSYGDIPKKGEVINPMATITPVPQYPSRSTVRPVKNPTAWD